MPLYLVTGLGPSERAVSLDYIKSQLRVTHDDDDVQLAAMLDEVIASLDGRDGTLGRALVSQTWDLALPDFFHCEPQQRPGAHGYSSDVDRRSYDKIEIPLPPLIEVESVQYYDRDNALQTVATSVYEVVGIGGYKPAYLALKQNQSWPATYDRPEAVIIRFTGGYVDTSVSPPVGEIPPPIRSAIKLLTELKYDPPSDEAVVKKMNEAAANSLRPFQVYSL